MPLFIFMKRVLAILLFGLLSCEKEVNTPDCYLITFGITNGVTHAPVTYCGTGIDTVHFRDADGNYLNWSAERIY